MRIRQVKPEFWKDARLADLTEGARLFYIGTWQLCDDAGWMRWDVANIAAELYPFEGRALRERRVTRHSTALVSMGRLHVHDCGHAQVPKMPAHQHLAGTTRRVLTVAQEHSHCGIPATPRDEPRPPAPVSIGSVRKGSVSNHAREEEIPKGRHLDVVDGQWSAKA
jgi:hypothetical protein